MLNMTQAHKEKMGTYYYQNEKNLVLYHPCTLRTFKKGRTLRTLCRVPYVLLIIVLDHIKGLGKIY